MTDTVTAAVQDSAPPPRFHIEADGTRVRILTKPIRGHEGDIREVRFREPRYHDFMMLGDPTAMVFLPNGGVLPHEDHGIIEKYAERLIVEQSHGPLLAQCSLDDALAIKEVILGFFCPERANSSTSLPTTSSSTSASMSDGSKT